MHAIILICTHGHGKQIIPTKVNMLPPYAFQLSNFKNLTLALNSKSRNVILDYPHYPPPLHRFNKNLCETLVGGCP